MSDNVALLTQLLADESVLYMKLRNYHWNVVGPNFKALHLDFEEQYTALALSIDGIAEMIRQYGANAIGTMSEILQVARLKEESPATYPSAPAMLASIAADHDAIIAQLRQDLETADDDEALEGFLTDLLNQHMKLAWMTKAQMG